MTDSRRHFCFLACVMVIPCSLSGQDMFDRWSMITLVKHHQETKKNLHAQDVYKIIYQNSFGNEHLLADTAAVREYLHEELVMMDTTIRGESLLERISLDGEMVRVNLRPFRALNLDPESLVQVMFHSARGTMPDTLMFYRQWNEFVALVEFDLVDFPPAEVAIWNEQVVAGNIKPVHHSEQYTAGNRPAYRVAHRSVFEAMVPMTK
ncbi:MAG: hypothetical protein HW407_89 [Bacteroidetes bacterium]|nr:hypothetical protein [Bacteroidota bacterium]